MIDINLTGQNAIVTGAGRGLGKAIAIKLAEAGANVAILEVNFESAEETAEEIAKLGVKTVAYKCNVADENDVNNVVDKVKEYFGKIDILVNNAGVNVIKRFTESTSEEFDQLVSVNLKGVFNGSKSVLRHMIPEKSGKIIMISSAAGKIGYPYHGIYSPTKFGVIGMMQVMVKELGASNINVNAVCPGIVRTEMWEKNLRELVDEEHKEERERVFQSKIEQGIPMGRPQTPEDISNAVLFLSSGLACNITGQALSVDGGQTLR